MNHETVENDLCKHNTESQRCKESLKVLHFSSSCPQFSACESLLIFQDPPQIPLYNLKSFLLAFVFFYFFTVIFTFHWASLVLLMVENPPASAGGIRDTGSIPGSGRSPGGGHGNPLQYSCLENPMDRGAWRAMVRGVAQSQTQLTQLSVHTRGS